MYYYISFDILSLSIEEFNEKIGLDKVSKHKSIGIDNYMKLCIETFQMKELLVIFTYFLISRIVGTLFYVSYFHHLFAGKFIDIFEYLIFRVVM